MNNYLILLDGPKGAGKSTLSELLRKTFSDLDVYSIDTERNLLTRTESITHDNERAFNVILEKLENTLKRNRNAVLDCGVTERRLGILETFVKKHDVSFHKFSLTAPYNVLHSRVEERDKAKGKVFNMERFDVIHKALTSKSFDDFCMIDSDKLSTQEMLQAVRSRVT
jgi:predicted kinase